MTKPIETKERKTEIMERLEKSIEQALALGLGAKEAAMNIEPMIVGLLAAGDALYESLDIAVRSLKHRRFVVDTEEAALRLWLDATHGPAGD
jgi:hypothetical protein